jgi:hypothetical protein
MEAETQTVSKLRKWSFSINFNYQMKRPYNLIYLLQWEDLNWDLNLKAKRVGFCQQAQAENLAQAEANQSWRFSQRLMQRWFKSPNRCRKNFYLSKSSKAPAIDWRIILWNISNLPDHIWRLRNASDVLHRWKSILVTQEIRRQRLIPVFWATDYFRIYKSTDLVGYNTGLRGIFSVI